MTSNYQKQLLEDLHDPQSYGKPLAGWKGQTEIFRDPAAPRAHGALTAALADTFVEQTYVLVLLRRAVRVYRGYELESHGSPKLRAPFGMDHDSFRLNLVAARKPGVPDGLWWSPARPSLSIDHLRLGSMHRAENRGGTSIKLEWNRLDYYVEAELAANTLVYAGRAAPQQDSAAYGGKQYGGGTMQFRLLAAPARICKYNAE